MTRLTAILVAAVLFWACPASATYYTHIHGTTTLPQSGHKIQNASIYVYDHADSAAHAVFSDMAETAITQPIATDADGFWEFYIEPEADVFIRTYKASLAIDDTLKHAVPNFSASNLDTLTVAVVDSIRPASGRTVYFRSDSGADDGYIDAFRGYLERLYGVRYFHIDENHSMSIERETHLVGRQAQRMGESDQYCMHIGESTVQLDEDTNINSAHIQPCASDATGAIKVATGVASPDSMYANYGDHLILGTKEWGGDTLNYFNALELRNARAADSLWCSTSPIGTVGAQVDHDLTTVRRWVKQKPSEAIFLTTNLPDSTGVGYEKTHTRILWDEHPLNAASSFLDMGSTLITRYAFQRDAIKLYGDAYEAIHTPPLIEWCEGATLWYSTADDDTTKCSIGPTAAYTSLDIVAPTDQPVTIDDLLRLKPRAAPAGADTVGMGGMVYFSSGATPHLYVLFGGTWHQLDN